MEDFEFNSNKYNRLILPYNFYFWLCHPLCFFLKNIYCIYCLFICLLCILEAASIAPPPMHDSAVLPCFHGCLAFLHRFFPPQSPPSCPLGLSLHSQQQPLPWDCSTIPMCQLPAVVTSREPASLSRVRMAAARIV